MQRFFPREEYFSVVSVLFAIKLKIRLKNDEVNERRTKKKEFMNMSEIMIERNEHSNSAWVGRHIVESIGPTLALHVQTQRMIK